MRLLIVGKLKGHIGTATRIAMTRGAQVTQVDDGESALKVLRSGKGADLVMVDVAVPIRPLIDQLALERFSMPVVACGLGVDPKEAVDAIKNGAKEYVPLPPDSDLIAAVFEAVARDDHTMINYDPSMTSIVKLAQQIAPSDASVLITGESGTGKEVMARFIHNNSRRKMKPFISINCAAIPEHLLESELFGHEKGAFTGAVARRIGKFEEANGGTLLLDEISEMQASLQAKLLRAIQERVIDRVGGTKPVPVDIRIIATSNRKLEDEVKSGNFREDLFFRLNVVPVLLPPLRERPLDIAHLVEHFIYKYTQANGMPLRSLSPEGEAMIRNHPWPGNIRELENTMHRAVLLATGDHIDRDVLSLCGLKAPEGMKVSNPEVSKNLFVGRTVSDVEKDLIIGTLTHCLGNRTQAAQILGISIRTLRNKLKQYSQDGEVIPVGEDTMQEAI